MVGVLSRVLVGVVAILLGSGLGMAAADGPQRVFVPTGGVRILLDPNATPVIIPTATRTPAPSPTATGTAQPTSTITPTPTATNVPVGSLQVMANHSWFTTSTTSLYVVGELQNASNSPVRFGRVTVNLFNGAQIVGTENVYTTLDVIPGGQRACFRALFFQAPAWTRYEFEAPTFSSGGLIAPPMTVLNVTQSYQDFLKSFRLVGQVRNDNAQTVRFVRPIATLLDASGTVMDCSSTYVNSTDLTAGQTSSFSLTSSRYFPAENVASYRLAVGGQ